MDVRSLVIRLRFGLDSRGADQADKRVANLSKNADGLANKMKMAGLALAGVGAYKIASELRESVDASISFGREMGNISSLIGGNQARTQELATASQQMAQKFGRSSKDITGGLYEVISTFGDTKDAIEQTQIAIKIGAAGAGSTADGISLLGAVTKAYGDTSAATMQKVSDLGFQTVNLGKVTLPELAGSIQQATPLAAALGVKLEELFAIQATASGVTGSGSEVFTQMNSAMKSLMERTPEMEKAFRKAFKGTGVKTAVQAVGKYGFVGALDRVIKTTGGTQEEIAKLFGRIEGLKLSLSLTGAQAGDFAGKMQAMQNVAGATDTAFKAQTTGLAGNAHALDLSKAAAEKLQQQIGDKLAGSFVKFQQAGNIVLQWIDTSMLPLFLDAGDGIDGFGSKLEALQPILKATETLIAGIASGVDIIASTAQLAGQGIGGAAATVYSALGGDANVARRVRSGVRADLGDTVSGLGHRLADRAGMVLGAPTGEQQARATWAKTLRDNERESKALGDYRDAHGGIGTQKDVDDAARYAKNESKTQVNNITMKITVPEGSEAAAVARINDQAIRQFVDQIHDQTARSYGGQP